MSSIRAGNTLLGTTQSTREAPQSQLSSLLESVDLYPKRNIRIRNVKNDAILGWAVAGDGWTNYLADTCEKVFGSSSSVLVRLSTSWPESVTWVHPHRFSAYAILLWNVSRVIYSSLNGSL